MRTLGCERWAAAIIILLLVGCASHNVPDPISRKVIARSVQGREIDMHVLGGAEPAVLVIGGIHGNEPTSVAVAYGLLDLLRSRPGLARGRLVAIIPNANPDGYARQSRYNANNIDVNRNFPARNFKPTPLGSRGGSRGGIIPLSEPESAAIDHAIKTLGPRLIISIHSISRGRQCNNYDGPAETIALIMSQHNGYPAAATIGYPTPGSLGSYAGIDQQIPMITLELPNSATAEEAWDRNRDALLAAIKAAR